MKADEYFEYWLRDRESLDEVVGLAHNYACCPFARWLISLGFTEIVVGSFARGRFSDRKERLRISIPLGFQCFIRAVDSIPGAYNRKEITARTALKALENARQQTFIMAARADIRGDPFYAIY